jgi:hypothetical protein
MDCSATLVAVANRVGIFETQFAAVGEKEDLCRG